VVVSVYTSAICNGRRQLMVMMMMKINMTS